MVKPSHEGMVTEDIASTSDEAQEHHDEGENEEAQQHLSEKETGTESCCMSTPLFSPPFFLFFLQSYFHFVPIKFLFDGHFAVLMSWQI